MKQLFFVLLLGAATNSFAQTTVNHYPNPASSEFTTKVSEPATFIIYNMLGKEVHRFAVTEEHCAQSGFCTIETPLDNLPAGKYVIRGRTTAHNAMLPPSVLQKK